ncbi:hypothetical protein ASD11_10550 [Aeromicrobium sp. Root495]|uniref:VOC family protein n=1 Tax=Aeromicrobium sp. Root495 TaxID=1736550 RepID=UPI0006F9D5EE|nr:VOC family protein [Aeromicrobium sp. Root495]KQY60768.1 hypothetical protein ASD11_10550 [Aeromicrobium sp. Root495]
MSLATFKDLCIDVGDLPGEAAFWAGLLGLRVESFPDDPDELVLRGDRPQQTVWPNPVPEGKAVKNRVHLDVWASSLDGITGTRVTEPGEQGWTTFTDPVGGQEFCVFTRADVGLYRLKDVVVDAAHHQSIAAWWAQVLGGTAHDDEGRYSYVSDIPGVPFDDIDFTPVPEPKTVKNRIHWDIDLTPGSTVADLVALGATVLREPDDDIRWTVMADPEGNEFCVFAPRAD